MSALRDGETVKFEVSPNDTINTGTGDLTIAGGVYFDKTRVRASIWRRLWFLVSCVPRYLISGSVEVP